MCKAPDWCSVSGDGAMAKCMRTEAGCFKVKEDRNGGRYFLHRLADGPRSDTVPPTRPAGAESKRADAHTLNEVYGAFLAQLALSPAGGVFSVRAV